MKKIMIILMLLALVPVIAAQECLQLEGGEEISSDTLLCAGQYSIENTIEITADNILFDCGDAVLQGSSFISAILVKNKSGVTIRNCEITGFGNAIYLEDAEMNTISGNKITDNNNGIVLHNSPENIILQNIYLNNRRDVFEFTTEQKDNGVENEMQISIELKQKENEAAESYNNIKELFSQYIDQSQETVVINRTIIYNATDNSTTIRISINPKTTAINYSYYEKIPKCMAIYAKEIVFKDTNYEVIVDDPIIRWNFAEPLVQEEIISYKIKKLLTEDCKKLLEGFGFATEFEKESDYPFIILGILITMGTIVVVLYVRRIKK
ncbi:MAG: right-handed parallel beta-helix repeat-containing protein [Nanoarchaeota archaeon]|nr:right-handed parallel beta-helix repeat-containing protein [Nanoarchaeota archaeon]